MAGSRCVADLGLLQAWDVGSIWKVEVVHHRSFTRKARAPLGRNTDLGVFAIGYPFLVQLVAFGLFHVPLATRGCYKQG